MAAARAGRQRNWVTAFRRSSVGRAIIRRLPGRVKRWLRVGRRWQRSAVAQIRLRWHRSLQLRVVSTTLVLSGLVIAVLGFFLIQSVAAGLLSNAENSADALVRNGRTSAIGQSSVNVLTPTPTPTDTGTIVDVATTTARALQQPSGTTGSYLVFIQLTKISPAIVHWVGQSNVNITATIPQTLIARVKDEQKSEKFVNKNTVPPAYEPTTLVYNSGNSVPALAVGVPLGGFYQLYYVFPFTQQQATLLLVQRVLVGVALAVIVLLAAIASLVTRWVVLPVRHAAAAAQRVSAGHLGERMQVHGVDDLAALATSFNEMAASLQGKLRELEDLSNVQRQFVSDVSHELRTPLSTIKMAADLLFEARAELDAAAGRSVELLQSQLDRFESLLVDLLEISRFDAGAATLDADLVDVCDLVRRSADDAQQLAERRGSRIEFRLPATGCFAEADRRRVERILRNILVNAVEHGEGKEVVVTTAMDSDAVAVSVRDYGVGLRPGEEQKVFDRFWRADPARARTTGGSGLGLAISLEDARLHGGWLEVWGERGKGSVFRLTLPRVAGQELAGSPLPLEPDEAEVAATDLGPGARPATEITRVTSHG
ncbi:MAG TPA: MtrAB system histidine kinase MtrB [Streptosporangiaceae bacterium]|nr:MtrAB system histidine kinase MtrB [Streptosporangiaceae bacterium]